MGQLKINVSIEGGVLISGIVLSLFDPAVTMHSGIAATCSILV